MSHLQRTARPRGRPREASTSSSSAKVLEKGLIVLKALSESDGVSLNDLSIDLEIPMTTLHRLLGTLETYGFVAQSKVDARWSIGVECFRVGSAFPRAAKLVNLARAILNELYDATGETANLGIVDGAEIVFIAQHETDHAIRAFFRPGTRASWHASGIGKAVMAFTPALVRKQKMLEAQYEKYTPLTLTRPEEFVEEFLLIKDQGYALDNEERHLGMRCVAAPVFDSIGSVIAGISVSGPVARLTPDSIAELSRNTRIAAYHLSRDLGAPDAMLELYRLKNNKT